MQGSDFMESSVPYFEPATAFINGKAVNDIPGVMLTPRSLAIHLHGRERIILYPFNSRMFPIEAKRKGIDQYKFIGPMLGFYHDTADIREGPYVNHYVEQLDISIAYPCNFEASLNIRGRCDLAKSSVDPYWYKGAVSGDWTFEVSFNYWFR
jgi:hypothetical protein